MFNQDKFPNWLQMWEGLVRLHLTCLCMVQNQIKSHYLAANANSAPLLQVWSSSIRKTRRLPSSKDILNALPLSVGKQIKRRLPLSTFCLKMVFLASQRTRGPVNFGALHQLTSGLQGSSQNCPIVAPTGGWPGCLWSPGGRFYKHRRRGEFEMHRWQKSSGLDGGYSRVTQWPSGLVGSGSQSASATA